jgi:hypothetical protein
MSGTEPTNELPSKVTVMATDECGFFNCPEFGVVRKTTDEKAHQWHY